MMVMHNKHDFNLTFAFCLFNYLQSFLQTTATSVPKWLAPSVDGQRYISLVGSSQKLKNLHLLLP